MERVLALWGWRMGERSLSRGEGRERARSERRRRVTGWMEEDTRRQVLPRDKKAACLVDEVDEGKEVPT